MRLKTCGKHNGHGWLIYLSTQSRKIPCLVLNGRCDYEHLFWWWMDGWMDGWMVGWTDGWMGGWMDGWVDGRTGGWMDGWMDGWVDGWTGGWMYKQMWSIKLKKRLVKKCIKNGKTQEMKVHKVSKINWCSTNTCVDKMEEYVDGVLAVKQSWTITANWKQIILFDLKINAIKIMDHWINKDLIIANN